MKVRIGIVGLPNVGKSTLFNALAQKSIAQVANFPFCTIEPNIAPTVAVPCPYLQPLATLANSKRQVPATMEFVDVAGLVKGANRGEGLGNRFLATIRTCCAICHVVRVHDNADIIHVNGRSTIHPTEDADLVNLELVLADLSHVQRRLDKTTCINEERMVLEKIKSKLQEGIPARAAGLSSGEAFAIKSMGLLTLKPVLYAFNVDEADYIFDRDQAFTSTNEYFSKIQYSDASQDVFSVISAKIEQEVSTMETRNKQVEYLVSLGIEFDQKDSTTLDDLLSYNVLPTMVCKLLGRSVVYTGPGVPPERSRTTRAHLYENGALKAIDMAGRLHGDFVKGFLGAEVVQASELLHHSSHVAAKEAGCVRTEGRDYVMQPHDVVLVKWKP